MPRVSATIRSRTRSSSGTRHHRAQQRPRIAITQTLDQRAPAVPASVLARLARREHQRDRLRQQPARHERQRLRRGPIQPLRVIDDTDKRPLLGRLRQQAQHRQPDQKPIRRVPRTQPERHAERLPLRTGKPVQAIEHRRAQLLQRRERELHLRLARPTARATRNPDAASIAYSSSAVLPTPGSPRTTSTRLCPARTAVEQPLQRLALHAPAVQDLRRPLGDHATATIPGPNGAVVSQSSTRFPVGAPRRGPAVLPRATTRVPVEHYAARDSITLARCDRRCSQPKERHDPQQTHHLSRRRLSSGSHLRAFRVLRAARGPLASAVGAPRGISPLRRLRRHEWSPVDRTVVIALLAIAFGCLFLLTYSLALGDPVPRRIDAALVGDPAAYPRTVDAVQGVAGGKLAFRGYASVPAARHAIDEQRVYAALDLTSTRPTLYVASAAGASVARVLERISAVDPAVRVVDTHRLNARDPNELDVFYRMLVATVIGFITVFQVLAQSGRRRCATTSPSCWAWRSRRRSR